VDEKPNVSKIAALVVDAVSATFDGTVT